MAQRLAPNHLCLLSDERVFAHERINTLTNAIGSAFGQAWRQKEIMVVDDGSTDGTLAGSAAI
jgi:hypothetical protein